MPKTKFKVEKNQEKKNRMDKIIKVTETKTTTGFTTLKQMKALEKALRNNLVQVQQDIKAAEKVLK